MMYLYVFLIVCCLYVCFSHLGVCHSRCPSLPMMCSSLCMCACLCVCQPPCITCVSECLRPCCTPCGFLLLPCLCCSWERRACGASSYTCSYMDEYGLLLIGGMDLELLLQQQAISWLAFVIWEGWDLGGYTSCDTLPCGILTSLSLGQVLRIFSIWHSCALALLVFVLLWSRPASTLIVLVSVGFRTINPSSCGSCC
eukprot:jgi/Botrbrau1/17097/Bobra.0157s0002.1